MALSSKVITKSMGVLGWNVALTLAYGDNDSYNPPNPGDVYNYTVGGLTFEMFVDEVVNSGGRGHTVTIRGRDVVSKYAEYRPFPKDIHFMSLPFMQREAFLSEINVAEKSYFNEESRELDFKPVIIDSSWFGNGGMQSNQLVKYLGKKAGFSEVYTNCLNYYVSSLVVSGAYLEALFSLVAPFDPYIFDNNNVLYILERRGIRKKHVQYMPSIAKGETISRTVSFRPKPYRLVVTGGDGPFNPAYYRGNLAKNSAGEVQTTMTQYYTPLMNVPLTWSAAFSSEFDETTSAYQARQVFDEDTWSKGARHYFWSYGPPIITVSRVGRSQYALTGPARGANAQLDWYLAEALDEAAFIKAFLSASGPSMDPIAYVNANFTEQQRIWLARNPACRIVLETALDAQQYFGYPEVEGERPEEEAITEGDVSITREVYSRTVTNTKGDLVYKRDVILSFNASRSQWFVKNVIETINYPSYITYKWERSRLESSAKWDERRVKNDFSPCQIVITWGFAAVPLLQNTTEAFCENYLDSRVTANDLASEEGGGSRLTWMPVDVDLVYRRFFNPAMLRMTESAIEQVKQFLEDNPDPTSAQISAFILATDLQYKVPALMEYLQVDTDGFVDQEFDSDAEPMGTIPKWLNAWKNENSLFKAFQEFGMNMNLRKPGDLIFETHLHYKPGFRNYQTSRFTPVTCPFDQSDQENLEEAVVAGMDGASGVFVPPLWTPTTTEALESALSAGADSAKRDWRQIFLYTTCLCGMEKKYYTPLTGKGGARAFEEKITEAFYDKEDGLMKSAVRVSTQFGPPPNEQVAPNPMQIEVRKDLYGAEMDGLDSSTRIEMGINVPGLCNWTDAENILRRAVGDIIATNNKSVWAVAFPGDLFFDVGWEVNLQDIVSAGNQTVVPSEFNNVGIISSVDINQSPQGDETTIGIEEL